jgi:palmitoyltransferase ZDHHC3/7/25
MCHAICTPPAVPDEVDEEEDEMLLDHSQQQQHSLLLSEHDGNPGSGGGGRTMTQQQQQQQNYYYIDHFNDLSYSCSCGTSDDNGIWMNRNDPAGTIMSCMVWVLIGYSILTITLLAHYDGIPVLYSTMYSILASLALSTHVKTTLTDPGSVPASAVPTKRQRSSHYHRQNKLSMCSQCQTYKPPGSHHCRICNRCISHMDHHCPWMNNCIGAGNMKHFLLFLIYTWICSVLSLTFFGYNYFFCNNESCMYNIILTQLVRIMTLLSVGALLFTSSMLMNVVYGIMTGIGTIDRLKKKASNTMSDSDEAPIPLVNIFGMNPYYTWCLPIDPLFPNYDTVMGYTTPQRLLREQMRLNTTTTIKGSSTTTTATVGPNTESNLNMLL